MKTALLLQQTQWQGRLLQNLQAFLAKCTTMRFDSGQANFRVSNMRVTTCRVDQRTGAVSRVAHAADTSVRIVPRRLLS